MRESLNARRVAIALLYAVAFVQCYVSFLHAQYEYAGYTLYQHSVSFIALSTLVATLPIVFTRPTRTVSTAIVVFIYLLIYVPTVLTFALGSPLPPSQIVVVQLTFMASMCALFLSDAIVVRVPLNLTSGASLMPLMYWAAILSTLFMLWTYRGNLAFSSFQDVYDLRFANEELGQGLAMRYISAWLTTVFVPVTLAYGLVAHERRYFIVGSLSCLVQYMATANKFPIVVPFVYVGFYYLWRRRLPALFEILAAALALAIFVLTFVTPESPIFLLTLFFLNRSIGNGGQLMMTYHDFFSTHPQTDYSHVTGINLFTHPYPYGDLGVGQVVGQYYWSPLMNANANFWATDGLAAMGLPGVLLVSVVAVALFAVINAVTRDYDTLFVVLCFIPFMVTLLNQSMFSAVWSGGGLLLIAFFLLNARPGHGLRAAAPAARVAAE